MNKEKLEWFEHAVAHPLSTPLWVVLFGWQVQSYGSGLYWLVPVVCLLGCWLSYRDYAPRLFAYYGRQDAIASIGKPEVAGVATERRVHQASTRRKQRYEVMVVSQPDNPHLLSERTN